MANKYAKAPGRKLKLGDLVQVTLKGTAGRHPKDPRILDKDSDPVKGDVRIVIGGRWYVLVNLQNGLPGGRPAPILVPAEAVKKL